MKKVLFVCLGNICRSPLAEAIFEDLIKKRGLKNYSSDSAGTGAYHIGDQPDPRTIQIAQKRGIAINHRARQYHASDAEEFDHIFAMDQQNYNDIISMTGFMPKQLRLLRSHNSSAYSDDPDVPDPYWGGPEGFSNIYDIMSDAINNFLDEEESA